RTLPALRESLPSSRSPRAMAAQSSRHGRSWLREILPGFGLDPIFFLAPYRQAGAGATPTLAAHVLPAPCAHSRGRCELGEGLPTYRATARAPYSSPTDSRNFASPH